MKIMVEYQPYNLYFGEGNEKPRPTYSNNPGDPSTSTPDNSDEINELKRQLGEKDDEIKRLKDEIASNSGSEAGDDDDDDDHFGDIESIYNEND